MRLFKNKKINKIIYLKTPHNCVKKCRKAYFVIFWQAILSCQPQEGDIIRL